MTTNQKERLQCMQPRLSGSQDDGYYTEYCTRVKGHRGDCKYVECF